MPLEKVSKVGRGSGTDEPLISLRKSGSIGINTAAVDEYFLDVDYVHVYYDNVNAQLGLKPQEEEDGDTYAVTKNEGTSGGAAVSPTAFLNRYHLIPPITTRYETNWNADKQMLIADLTSPAGTYGSADESNQFTPANRQAQMGTTRRQGPATVNGGATVVAVSDADQPAQQPQSEQMTQEDYERQRQQVKDSGASPE